MSVLSIYIPESGLAPGSERAFPWVLREGKHNLAREGVSGANELPKADQCEVVVPASMVVLTQVKLPPASRQKLRQLLPYAVEDKLFADPETVHVAAGPRLPNGATPVAVVEKNWFRGMLGMLLDAGLQPERVVAETCLPELQSGTWSVIWNGRDGFVRTGAASGLALDVTTASGPPLALSRCLEEAKAKGEAPESIVVRPASETASLPPLEDWSAALGIPVEEGEVWTWARAPRDVPINLLQGEFAPSSGIRDALPRLKPVFILGGLIIAVQLVATLIDWGLLAREERHLHAEMEKTFRTAFPEAKVIVDAPLQMKRNLADLKRSSGQGEAGDFLPLLGQMASVLKLDGGRMKSINYDHGTLKIDLVFSDPAAADRLKARLPVAGTNAKLESAVPKAGGIEARITLSASRQ